jgi:folate-binding protein YgfZ
MSTLPHGSCRLDDWGLIQADGPDAAAFLHGQLTQAVSDLGLHQARPGGYCSAKGRLMATFVLRRSGPEQFQLLLPLDVLAPLMKKLSMFVLRSKLKFSQSELAVHGLIGDAVPESLTVWGGDADLVRLPDALGQRRALRLGEAHDTLLRAAWDWAELHAGLAWIRAATSEHFVPQMVNWELVGGVDFKKGCYPGQEVVARSQYRGTVKRRLQLLLGASAAPGTELLGPEGAVGEVVQGAQWNDEAGVLAEVQLAAWDSEMPLTVADGRPLRRAALPYAVKAPE